MLLFILGIIALLLIASSVTKEVKRRHHVWCKCYTSRPILSSLGDIFSLKEKKGEKKGLLNREGEFWELILAIGGIRDEGLGYIQGVYHELSDIAYACGKIVGRIFGREYISMIGDGASYATKHGRMVNQGCFRSKRLLVNGRCPSK